jgi:hypothetical protein
MPIRMCGNLLATMVSPDGNLLLTTLVPLVVLVGDYGQRAII